MIKAIIIDDEFVSRNVLKKLINLHCANVEIVRECTDADEGRQAIEEIAPQLVFLDISMPGKSGLQMLRELPEIRFEVIFVTAFHEYTIQAIRYSAIDYLLKPVDRKELEDAVERATRKIEEAPEKVPVQAFLHNLMQVNNQQDMQLCVPGIKGFQIINIRDIIYCEADNTYTHIYMADGKKLISSRTLGDYENLLKSASYFRIHKSWLINLRHLKEYRRTDGGTAVMDNGRELEVSKRKREPFVAYLKNSFLY